MEDSLFPNKRNPTDYKYIIKENEMNIKIRTETREENIKYEIIYKQYWIIFFTKYFIKKVNTI